MKKRLLSLTLIIILLLSTTTALGENGIDTEYIESLTKYLEQNYLYEIEEGRLTEGALRGIFGSLDPYTGYYTEEEYKRLTENLTGEMDSAGIGIRVIEEEGNIKIIEIIKDNPAEKSGLKIGDTIVSVDDIDVRDLSIENTSNLIRGEKGTKVKMGIKRSGESKTLYFLVDRQPIVFNPVEFKELEGKIGYIKISEFNHNSYIGVKDSLRELDKKNIKKVVFDVRDNPGGYLSSVIDTLKLLVPEGPIVHVKDSHENMVSYNSYNSIAKYSLMVLTNENSASAAEIFAGAVQDRGVGKTVGTKTFGKGTVQNIVPLNRGGAIKLTVAEYFTPNMKRVNKVGIKPDILVNNIYNKEETDQTLKKALEEIKK